MYDQRLRPMCHDMRMNLSKLHKLPWTADPDTFADDEGLTLSARLAEDAVAILRRAQREAFGDSYDRDAERLWNAIMDGTIETRHECLAWIRTHCVCTLETVE